MSSVDVRAAMSAVAARHFEPKAQSVESVPKGGIPLSIAESRVIDTSSGVSEADINNCDDTGLCPEAKIESRQRKDKVALSH